jgi:hypothetical protein
MLFMRLKLNLYVLFRCTFTYVEIQIRSQYIFLYTIKVYSSSAFSSLACFDSGLILK